MRLIKYVSLVLIVLFSHGHFAAKNDVIETNGYFYSSPDDSVSFVKKQLLAKAFKNALTAELKTMNLDHELFWANYEQKLGVLLEKKEKDLALKMKMIDEEGNPNPKVSGARKTKFRKSKRRLKLKLEANFGNLNSIVSQYSISKMTKSVKDSNSRYIRVKATINRANVHRLYMKFTYDQVESSLSKLYLSTNFTLSGMNWTDTGVEVESDFTDVVRQHWKDKMMSMLGDYVDEVIMADASTIQELKFAAKAKNVKYQNALWMNVNVYITKTSESLDTQMREFVLRQEMTLQDAFSGKMVTYADFNEVKKEYSFSDNKALSSNLAGHIYQNLVGVFSDIPNSLDKKRRRNQKVSLEVTGKANMSDLLAFKSMLTEVGLTQQFLPELSSLSEGKALITLHYAGSSSDTMKLLAKVDQAKLREKKLVNVEDLENPTRFRISEQN